MTLLSFPDDGHTFNAPKLVRLVSVVLFISGCGYRHYETTDRRDERMTCAEISDVVTEMRRATKEDYYVSTFRLLAAVATFNFELIDSDDRRTARASAYRRLAYLETFQRSKCSAP